MIMQKIFLPLFFFTCHISSKAQQIYLAENGLSATPATGTNRTVKLGGTLTGNTTIDLTVNYLEFTKGATNLLRILHNGNIGIGTNSPSARLTIAGPNAGASGLQFTQLNSSSPALTNNGKHLAVDANGHVILTNATGGTVTSIGLSMPSGFFVIGSPITSSGTFIVTTNLNGIVKGNGSGFTTGLINLGTEVNGILPLSKGGTGLQALGTPNQLLRVNASSSALEYFTPDDLPYWNLNGTKVNEEQSIGTITEFDLPFITNNTERLRITANGNVGIGLNTPEQKLDVDGNIRSTGLILPVGAGSGKVLTSDENGTANWQTLPATPSSAASNGLIKAENDFQLGSPLPGSGLHNFNTNRHQYLNGNYYSIEGTVNDPVTKPVFRFYDNGDFTANAINNYTNNTWGDNGLRYNAKYGILEVGTANNFDTTLNTTCCNSPKKSAIIINSDFVNTIKGHVHGSIVAGNSMLIDTSTTIAWSTLIGEAHRIRPGGLVNKSNISGYGMIIDKEIYGSIVSGNANQLTKPVRNSIINGFVNYVTDSTAGSVVNGFNNRFGGYGQLVIGGMLTDKTPFGTTLGYKNVDFTSLPYVGLQYGAAVGNIQAYPIFALGNSTRNNISSNALTILYNGRTQVNTTGITNNLTEADVTPKAALEVVSSNSGVLLPKLTTAQRDAIATTDLHNGLLLYNIDENKFQFYTGNGWKTLTDSINQNPSDVWKLAGNSNTNHTTDFIGTVDNEALSFRTNNLHRLIIDSVGNVGIGTPIPMAQLHTTGTVRFSGIGSDNSLTQVMVSDAEGNISWRDVSTIGSTGNNAWTINGNNIYNTHLAGNVGIGTANPQAKLAVNGNIFAKKVKVTQTGWPDYVFDPRYELPSLKEIEQYIKSKKHLPGIPSADEVDKEGIDLGDNQSALLKKIEELTLHIIAINKTVEKLIEENKAIKKELENKKQ